MKFSRLLPSLLLTCCLVGTFAACDEAADPTPPSEDVVVEYIPSPTTILRSDTGSDSSAASAISVMKYLRENINPDIAITTDWVKRGEEVPALNGELVIGVTNRAESTAEYDALVNARPNSTKDWSIREVNGAVLITGASDEALASACEYFIANYITDEGIRVPKGEVYEYKHIYPEINIGSDSIFDYAIAPTDNYFFSGAVEYLRAKVSTAIGWQLPSEGSKTITTALDTSLDDTKYHIQLNSSGIAVTGGTYDAVVSGVEKLTSLMLAGAAESAYNTTGSVSFHTPDTKEPTVTGSYTSIGDATWLIDDYRYHHSGWDIDYSGDKPQNAVTYASSYASAVIRDTSVLEKCGIYRPIQVQTDGVITLDLVASVGALDGFSIGVIDSENNQDAVTIVASEGKLTVGDKTAAEFSKGVQKLYLQMKIDLDRKVCTLIINGKESGELPFSGSAECIDQLVIESTPAATVSLTPSYIAMYRNMPVIERFTMGYDGQIPAGWNITGDCSITEGEDMRLVGETTASQSFDAFDGKAAFELKFLANTQSDGVKFVLSGGGKDAVSVTLQELGIFQGEDMLRHYNSNFWYTLRFEADTRTQSAQIKINGKSLGWFKFENSVTSFDNIRITTPDGSDIQVDDIVVSQINDYEDYVPAPLSAGSDGYYVAAQVCSLWRNGYHFGWDVISPYPELEPVLGYYDEGIVEVADWEIKYMAEHGVDYQLYCWYASTVGSPIKMPNMYDALHDGYFHAKYSDQIKFAFMWENANGSHPGSSDNFRKYIIPYWVEYYLTDERYMTIDNKPVITVFSTNTLIEDFGSAANVKAEFEYLREVCRGLGYDGAIIMCQGASASQLESFGADATYAYNWGKSNTSTAYINNVMSRYNAGAGTVPTISVGFNNVAWATTRSALITPEDYKVALEWVRDTYSQNAQKEGNEWMSKSIVLSTWNEYGEGTYIMPAENLHGFAYLDAVREVFAPDNEYENIVPTESQKERLSNLYPQDRHLLRADYKMEASVSGEDYGSVHTWDFSSGAEGWMHGFGLSDFTTAGGTLKGTSSGSDYAVYSADNLNIDLTGIAAIHVRIKSSITTTMEIFYTTTSATTWAQNRSVSAPINKSGEYVDIYLPTVGKSTFTGTLKQLRIDPGSTTGSTFEIEMVELMCDEPRYSFVSGDFSTPFRSFYPYEDDGVLMFTIDPRTALLAYTKCTTEWDSETESITVRRQDKFVTFTIGSKTAKTNSGDVTLSHVVEEVDGLPVVPFDDMVSLLGLENTSITYNK
ncbi:MAG: glycoside hydrolase family 99-like domain-containing protein [Clostridia bacterium]|nr:glycoside hydrolase family 99-like domain-containing protein [Clostridia bacterium]